MSDRLTLTCSACAVRILLTDGHVALLEGKTIFCPVCRNPMPVATPSMPETVTTQRLRLRTAPNQPDEAGTANIPDPASTDSKPVTATVRHTKKKGVPWWRRWAEKTGTWILRIALLAAAGWAGYRFYRYVISMLPGT